MVPFMSYYCQALFDKWPPLPEFELAQGDVQYLAEMLEGRPMRIASPSPEDLQLWGLECYEQYAIYDAYACCRWY